MNLITLVGVVGNILSVVGIVILNKYITEVDGFNFMVFLSFLHFAFTCVGITILIIVVTIITYNNVINRC